ncbi:MAG: hypothetical protein LKJ83_10135 [Eubacteriaceae bacterium]|jgi:hypothetical protein|nr:hypothetical protein [Eubacteriaceae bacterium]
MKRRKMHHSFQRLRAFGAGAKRKLSAERLFNRCGPVNGGANQVKSQICTTVPITSWKNIEAKEKCG